MSDEQELSPEAQQIKAEVEAQQAAEQQAAMDHAVLSELEFDAMTPRLHRKEAQELLHCPLHGIDHPVIKALQASAGRPGMTKAEKVEAVESMRDHLVEAQKRFSLAVQHVEAAIKGYKEAPDES